MRKIKILSDWNSCDLEREVNVFISNHNITDIQFQASKGYGGCVFACMIAYEE